MQSREIARDKPSIPKLREKPKAGKEAMRTEIVIELKWWKFKFRIKFKF